MVVCPTLPQVRPHLEDRHTIVSIAAGITLQSLKVCLGVRRVGWAMGLGLVNVAGMGHAGALGLAECVAKSRGHPIGRPVWALWTRRLLSLPSIGTPY